MTLRDPSRPESSPYHPRTRHAGAVALLMLVACSDPPVGARRPDDVAEQPARGDGGPASFDGGTDGGITEPVDFGRDIRPLMSRGDSEPFGCKRCHYRGGSDPQGLDLGGLDLTTLGDLRRGGVSSKRGIVVPGDPSASAIVQKLEGTYPRGSRMPKDRTPWTQAEIALLRRWIAEGANGADDQ